MGFLMDGLEAEKYDRKYNDQVLALRIMGYFRPELPRMLIVAVAILLASLVDVLLPVVISGAIDRVQMDVALAELVRAAILIGLLAGLSWLFNAVRMWLSAISVGNVVLTLRKDAFDAILARDMSFYDTYPTGKIVSRVSSDTQAFSQVVILTVDLISRLLQITLLIGYLFTVSLQLTLITLAIAPVVVLVALAFRHVARETVTQSRRVNAEISALFQETVSGIRIAKTFRQENAIYDRFIKVNERSYITNLRTGWVFSGIFPLLSILAGFGTAVIVYFGGLQARAGGLSAGDWYLFIQAIAIFWFPLTSIASFWSQFQLGMAAGERIFALIDAEPAVVQKAALRPETIRGEIVFDKVHFQYTDKEVVLHDFSLRIPAGQTLALVGHTGAGKSSIGKLIARFYEFQEGQIIIDGIDIRNLDLSRYRTRLGIVTQTPFLFDGTVLDNIRYGKPDASDAQVATVAQQIGNGDWIDSLPLGLDSQVGERGSNLSMGQKQLVALARVLLEDPAIFILDEATASVDPLTEALIQEGLEVVLRDRTSIVIAHRLSTIRNADRIIVLKKGAIIEEGTHNSLLQDGGHYAELYNTYFRHQSLEYIEQVGNVMGTPG